MGQRIAIFTGTRADWGLLSPVARALSLCTGVEVVVCATNMHLSERHGSTLKEIISDGFDPEIVPMNPEAVNDVERGRAMGDCLASTARVIDELRPDAAVVLGDRFEMLAVASACLMARVPIVHIAGGETTLGAVDDSIRHAITKMATLHLTSTEEYRQRVISMGAPAENVVNTGALGVWNIAHLEAVPRRELENELGLPLDNDTLLVTYHPATLDEGDINERVDSLTTALDRLIVTDGKNVLATSPNNDADGDAVYKRMSDWAQTHIDDGRVRLVASLGRRRYLSALRYVGCVVGNSSSGLVEVPSAGIPTVNIGIRQSGRAAGRSVINCGDTSEEIYEGVKKAFSPEMRAVARRKENPYYQPDTLEKSVDAIIDFLNR